MNKILKKFGIMMIMLAALFGSAKADLIEVGNGTVQGGFPFYTFYMDASSYFLYKNTQIATAGGSTGTIKSIAMNVSTAAAQPMNGFQIFMQNTTLQTLTGAVTTNWTLVYSSPSYSAVTGWNTFVLQNPFSYDGAQNLLLKICFNNSSWTGSSNVFGTTLTGQTWCGYSDLSADDGCTYNFTFGQTPSLPNIRIDLDMNPNIVAVYPVQGAVLQTNMIYDAPPHKPGVMVKRTATQPATLVSYEIAGPLPSTNVIYRAHEEGVASDEWINMSNIGEPFEYRFTEAKFAAARQMPSNDGALDLYTNSIPGGEYEITAKIRLQAPGDATYEKTYKSKFIIALANDLAVTQIVEPKKYTDKKYPLGQIPVRCIVRNVGLNPVTHLKVFAEIYKNGQRIYLDSTVRQYPGNLANPLLTGEGITLENDFRVFNPSTVGDYTIKFRSVLLSATDQGPTNDIAPAEGDIHTFRVAYDQEPQADSIYIPLAGSTLFVGRPVRPFARFSNNGITDMSDVLVRMKITNLTTNTEVYNFTTTAQDIPAGVSNNFAKILWNTAFVPPSPGSYQACASVEFPNDPVMTNNVVCVNFNVSTALNGTYTIGVQNLGQPRNYATMQLALNDLFIAGVSGPVVFEFTDAEYNEGNIFLNTPALDFRSRIVGMSATNTVTFRPNNQRMVIRGGVRINLHSASGIGMMFGQTQHPGNMNAPVHVVQPSLVKQYSNSEGYFIFDGGEQKAFLFTLNTTVPYRAVFYMSSAKNITVKNSLIEDGLNQAASTTCTLPNNMFNPSLFQFAFEKDYEAASSRSYSAAVVLRSVPPVEEKFSSNYFNMDTINTTNIQILNNEIKNFGYGIVSQGIGVLIYQSDLFTGFKRYFNSNNKFNNNKIYNVSRAGIFVGFEENTNIEKNRIYNVTGVCGNDAAGIIAGGEDRGGMWGFGNAGLYINSNEISQVNGTIEVYGIKIEQGRVTLNDPARGIVNFPDITDNNKVVNNIIWGLNPLNANVNRYGIRYFTKRESTFDNPLDNKQFTMNDRIINNTIVIDNDGFVNTGITAAVALQQTKNTFMYNNAIAMMDENLGTSNVASLLLYNGYMPADAASEFNRNAYWITPGSNASFARFIFTSDSSTTIEYGNSNDYASMTQWRYWTGQEWHSIFGNFMADMNYIGTNPQNLRVKLLPLPPKSSILNNRGDRLAEVTTDIDGNNRGVANQRYDIGAIEFNGRFYTSDLELMNISEPGSYKATTGTFSDAEYIMTEAPVNVKARIRNNGNIQQTNLNVHLKIYRETPAELGMTNFVGTLEKSKTIQVSISSTDDVNLDFLLANEGGLNDDWTPKTYSDLRGTGYTVPANFTSMQPNVTPRYRIEVTLDQNVDEVLENNTLTKVVRFYLKRSSLSILLSTENSHIAINHATTKLPLTTMNNLDQIAGRLNVDSLITGFKRIGWEIDYSIEFPRYDLDIFERNSWEPRNVNYTMYRTMFWSDGNDNALTRQQVLDIDRFFAEKPAYVKRNFIVGSQEFVRLNQGNYKTFIEGKIRAKYDTRTGANMPFNPTLDITQRAIGVAIARNLEASILGTGWNNMTTFDLAPSAVYYDLVQTNYGLTRVGFYYKNPTNVNANSKVMTTATSTLDNNVVMLGLDWRHFGNSEFMLRAIIDYIENNGGTVIPVELLSFEANAVGSRVELNWATASEQNASRFEVERALVGPTGVSSYAKIDEIAAAGNSNTILNYGPIVDRNVNAGATYSYRLRMVDINGEFKYSNERTVSLDGSSFSVGEVKPNPVVNNAKFDVTTGEESSLNITVYDMNGRAVATIENGSANNGEVSIDTKNFANGTYTVVFNNGSTIVTRSFTVVR